MVELTNNELLLLGALPWPNAEIHTKHSFPQTSKPRVNQGQLILSLGATLWHMAGTESYLFTRTKTNTCIKVSFDKQVWLSVQGLSQTLPPFSN